MQKCYVLGDWLTTFEPNSVIRDRTDFVRMSGRLSVGFAEGVAGYAEEERQGRCRQTDESGR
ncbi:hypothetical protein [Bacteroides heparinolyticus]|uniref:hypothetical protein n=1 Tax=Prevotella heparinolytica TaxID=28113 RepID=UPI00359FE035